MAKSQAAMEYIFLIGTVLVVIIFLSYYATRESTINIQMNQANDAVNILANAVDSVYILGPGSQKNVKIEMPGGVEGIVIDNKEILFKVRIFGNLADISAETKAEVNGTISKTKGSHNILVKTSDSGIVNVEE